MNKIQLNINDIQSNLTTIQNYTEVKRTGSLPKAEKKELSKTAREAFKSLQRSLGNGELLQSMSIESLDQIRSTIKAYQDITKKHWPITNFTIKLFGMEKKVNIAQSLEPQMNPIIQNKKTQIREAIEQWKLLPSEEAKNVIKTFVMSMVKENMGFYPTSFGNALSQIDHLASNDEQILSLTRNVNLFSSSEIKNGRLKELELNPLLIADRLQACLQKFNTNESHILSPQSDPENLIEALREDRFFRLHHLQEVYDKVSQDPSQAVNSKFFPLTTGWYVGSFRELNKIPFEEDMQKIGKEHQIIVVTDPLLSSPFTEAENILVLNQTTTAIYPQDFMDCSRDEIRVPLMLDPKYDKMIIYNSVVQGRKERDPERWNRQFNFHILAETIEMVRQPYISKCGIKAVALASAIEAKAVMNLTYSEGGNTLMGNKFDGSLYVIIGKDSYAASKALMKEDLGREMTENEVKMAFAIDYGTRTENIFFVEQPGDFHLDMNMAVGGVIDGKNIILLNDAVQSAKVFEPDLQEWLEKKGMETEQIQKCKQQAMTKAEIKKIFEDKAQIDLEQQGFTVMRVPGRFNYERPYGDGVPVMNFFNMVTAKAPQGEKIVVTTGMINSDYLNYEEKFYNMLNTAKIETDIIYFLDIESSQESLRGHAGISCRTKTI